MAIFNSYVKLPEGIWKYDGYMIGGRWVYDWVYDGYMIGYIIGIWKVTGLFHPIFGVWLVYDGITIMRYSFFPSTEGTDVLDVLGYYNPHDWYTIYIFLSLWGLFFQLLFLDFIEPGW